MHCNLVRNSARDGTNIVSGNGTELSYTVHSYFSHYGSTFTLSLRPLESQIDLNMEVFGLWEEAKVIQSNQDLNLLSTFYTKPEN